MGKFKTFIDNQKTDLKSLIYNYTVTIISVALFSIVFCIDMELDKDSSIMNYILTFLFVFAVGAMFIETFFVDKNQAKDWGRLIKFYVINGLLSLAWTILLVDYDEIIDNKSIYSEQIFSLNLVKIFEVYLAALVLLSVYKLVKKSGLGIDIYLARAGFGLLKVWGLFFALYLAMCLLLSIFDTLIMDLDYWDFIDNITILLCGFVYFPYSLLMITDTGEENSRFTKGFINYALMPCVIIAIVIVYMYILKIIVNWDMPSNEVFDICINVFIIGGPIWLMSYGFLRTKKEETCKPLGLYGRLVKNIKYAYIPLIILEIIAIGMRIGTYGLTEERYLGVVAIIFQIIYVLWDAIGKLRKKELKQEGLIIVGLVILTVALLCPVINMNKLSYLVQKTRFENALEREDYITAGGAYGYLRFSEYGEEYLDKKYTQDEREKLQGQFYDTGEAADKNYDEYIRRYVSYDDKKMGINVEGYTDIYPFEFDGDYDTVYVNEDLTHLTITYGDGVFEVHNVDISAMVKESTREADVAENDNFSRTMPYEYIALGNNCCVVIEDIDFKYNTYSGEVSNLNFEGYILTNEGGHNGQ